jgi:hypothetical protein
MPGVCNLNSGRLVVLEALSTARSGRQTMSRMAL